MRRTASDIPLWILASAFIALAPLAAHAQACPPAGYTKSALQSLKSQKFTLAAADAKRALAGGLLACLASPIRSCVTRSPMKR